MNDVRLARPANTPTARCWRRSDDGVGLITFNQPEKRNAMSLEMWIGLGEILDEFARGRLGARGGADRCRRQGVRLGRGYQPVREEPVTTPTRRRSTTG